MARIPTPKKGDYANVSEDWIKLNIKQTMVSLQELLEVNLLRKLLKRTSRKWKNTKVDESMVK